MWSVVSSSTSFRSEFREVDTSSSSYVALSPVAADALYQELSDGFLPFLLAKWMLRVTPPQFGRVVSYIPFPSVPAQSNFIVTWVATSLYRRSFIESKRYHSSSSFHSELREVDTSRLLSTKSGQNFQSFFSGLSLKKAVNSICREKIVKILKRTWDMTEMFLGTCTKERKVS